jgi:trehalose 6-phosphate phosphatase
VIQAALAPLAAQPERSGILLDFDGTLTPIVSRPDEVIPEPAATEVLRSLAERFGVVAVISGRPTEDLERFVGVDGVRYEGLYGLPPGGRADALVSPMSEMAKTVSGAWVETKGSTVALHYRAADDIVAARSMLASTLEALAERSGYDVIEGKMVFELVPKGDPRKGGSVERLVRAADLTAALYAGDDLPDLEAFAALDALAREGLHAVKIAVGGPEMPEGLRIAADLVLDDPSELIALLRSLA